MATRTADEAERWRAEAERQHAEAKRWKAVAEEQASELTGLRAQVAALTEKVTTYAKLLFGKSSEKKSRQSDPEAGPAQGDDGSTAPQPPPPPADGQRRKRGQRPGSKGHGRRDYSKLESEERLHDLPEGKRVCPDCGAQYAAFGEETSEQVDWQVRVVRVVHRRPTYRRTCRCRVPGVIAAPVPPKVIPKGLFSAVFLARLLTEKYVLGRPLERIVAALAHDGLEVATGTLVGVIEACSALLAPLDEAIRERNAESGHLHIDETSWRVFTTLSGDVDHHKSWLWVFLGPDTVVFIIDPTRSTEVLRRHLGIDMKDSALEGDRRLLVSSDFYGAYQNIATVEGVDPLYCWAHIRRYFIRAAASYKNLAGWSAQWLERIGALYAAHKALAATEPGSAKHARAETAFRRAFGRIDAARKREAKDRGLHWKCYEVLATLDHEWDGLRRHREYPELPLDNNPGERIVRNPVVGRKNYYGSGSPAAATAAGRIWTVTATAKLAGWNPLAHLHAYLEACARNGGRPLEGKALKAFLPWSADAADVERYEAAPRPGGPAP